MTIKLATRSRCALIGSVAALMLSVQTSAAQKAPDARPHSATVGPQPFPGSVARYVAPLFELIEPREKRYDERFARQLRGLVAPQLANNAKFLARLTSGPTLPGIYVVTGQHGYVYYAVCQAHQCDNTTMDLLFDPARNRMVGKLLDSCKPFRLGQPDNVEMALLERHHRVNFPTTVTTCTGDERARAASASF
jgi:hypothetical protein